jgi:ribosomal protein L7/L12
MERPISSNALAQVQTAVFNGEKIAAIKIYREDTGASLKEAKEAVDKLESGWRVTFPEKFKATAKKKGCGICLLILLAGVGVILLLILSRRS